MYKAHAFMFEPHRTPFIYLSKRVNKKNLFFSYQKVVIWRIEIKIIFFREPIFQIAVFAGTKMSSNKYFQTTQLEVKIELHLLVPFECNNKMFFFLIYMYVV